MEIRQIKGGIEKKIEKQKGQVSRKCRCGILRWGKTLAMIVPPKSHRYPMPLLHFPDLMNQESALTEHYVMLAEMSPLKRSNNSAVLGGGRASLRSQIKGDLFQRRGSESALERQSRAYFYCWVPKRFEEINTSYCH